MTSLAPVATEPAVANPANSPAECFQREALALGALGQLERDLQRLARALPTTAAPPPPRSRRRVRWPRVRRAGGGYPAL